MFEYLHTPGVSPELDHELFEAYERMPDSKKDPATHTRALAEDLSAELRHTTETLLTDLLGQEPLATKKLKQTFSERAANLPRTEIYDTPNSIAALASECGYRLEPQSIFPDEVLITLRIPPHLNQYYQKTKAGLVAWGPHYEGMINHIWSTVRTFASEHDLVVNRLNAPGFHDNTKYYYLFLLSPNDGRGSFPHMEPKRKSPR
ncbi:MAG TPA: hypothetical protein DCY48_02835 [Candidatus Magasanikbacteria bacterium]|nr:MAG: hypothetical protein A3I74_02190 [Candidatus Magasanikbacteria bacterium RIFCSPLOWO2_02_FULL_47_16]OGH79680.1 MAG: hypothetical protein A3C10_01215 [Candidatus Magasanikbacteria bacterium RIFCSPHIGHO2_02_FULL_48_18]HAZ28687.1 hypothetical protein [Candidatus Magasanikbacteria bacterium]